MSKGRGLFALGFTSNDDDHQAFFRERSLPAANKLHSGDTTPRSAVMPRDFPTTPRLDRTASAPPMLSPQQPMDPNIKIATLQKKIYSLDSCSHGRRPHWERAYVCLRKSGLYCFPSPQDDVEIQAIRFVGAADSEEDPVVEARLGLEENTIVVTSNQDDGVGLLFESSEQRKEWLDQIQNAISASRRRPLFGNPLEKEMRPLSVFNTDPNDVNNFECPKLILKAIVWLEQHATKTEGIFRVPGQTEAIAELKDLFNKDRNAEIPEKTNPHAVASVLKAFYSSLHEPIFTFQLYDQFIAAKSDSHALAKLVKKLPARNRIVLNHLMRFLSKFKEHGSENMMDAPNLARVFGMTFSQPKNASLDQCAKWGRFASTIIETMINHYEEVFAEDIAIENTPMVETKNPLHGVETPEEPLQPVDEADTRRHAQPAAAAATTTTTEDNSSKEEEEEEEESSNDHSK